MPSSMPTTGTRMQIWMIALVVPFSGSSASTSRCSMADNRTPNGRLWNAKRDARNREIAWRLTDAQALALFAGPCYWCGVDGPNGIDRENNEPYYSTRNSVSCCKRCNIAKSTMKPNEWLDWLRSVLAWQYKDEFAHEQFVDI